jgi:hypothetical protein
MKCLNHHKKTFEINLRHRIYPINYFYFLLAISACSYGVGFVIFLVGGIVYGQQDAEVGHKADANFGVKGQP